MGRWELSALEESRFLFVIRPGPARVPRRSWGVRFVALPRRSVARASFARLQPGANCLIDDSHPNHDDPGGFFFSPPLCLLSFNSRSCGGDAGDAPVSSRSTARTGEEREEIGHVGCF